MKSVILLSLASFLTGAGVLRGADGVTPPAKKDAAAPLPAVAALDTIQKALRDLPPGAEVDRIKKALARIREQIVKELQGRLELAESDLENWSDRLQWTKRMVAKGLISSAQARASQASLDSLRRACERLRDDLKRLGAGPAKRP